MKRSYSYSMARTGAFRPSRLFVTGVLKWDAAGGPGRGPSVATDALPLGCIQPGERDCQRGRQWTEGLCPAGLDDTLGRLTITNAFLLTTDYCLPPSLPRLHEQREQQRGGRADGGADDEGRLGVPGVPERA